MGWKELKGWLKGGIIGLVFSALLFVSFIICVRLSQGEEGMGCIIFMLPPFYATVITGLEYFFAVFDTSAFSFFSFFIGFFILVLLFAWIGFLFDSRCSSKKRIIGLLIPIILFSPLIIHNSYLKYHDNKIIEDHTYFGAWWYISDHSTCEELSVFNKIKANQCFDSKLVSEEMILRWSQLKDEEFVKDCIKRNNNANCMTMFAVETKDMSLCELHPHDYEKNSCVGQVAIAIGNISGCPIESDFHRNSCIIRIAELSEDIGLCEEIKGENYNHSYFECKFRIFSEQDNVALCEELENLEPSPDVAFRDKCITGVAKNRKESELCGLIKNNERNQGCLQNVAIETQNPDLCRQLESHFRNICIDSISIQTKNKELCNELDEPRKTWCKNR